MKNKPKKIYLVCGDTIFPTDDFEEISEGVCWCKDRIYPTDIEYIRKDLYDNLKKRYNELKAQLASAGRPWPCDMNQDGL